MIFFIFVVFAVVVFAIRFTTLEGKRQNKHRQFRQAKDKVFSKDVKNTSKIGNKKNL